MNQRWKFLEQRKTMRTKLLILTKNNKNNSCQFLPCFWNKSYNRSCSSLGNPLITITNIEFKKTAIKLKCSTYKEELIQQ